MDLLLDYLVRAMKADPTLAGLASLWMALILWGASFAILAYWARVCERSAMVAPPRHPWFPRSRQ